ncbi:MAG: ADOP family duplicated permease [Longimicrobiales bacterium]
MRERNRRGSRRRLVDDDARKEVDDELSFHFEQRVRDYMARGLDEVSAREAALARLGNLANVRGECAELLEAASRAHRQREWFDDVRRDVAFGLHSAAGSPLFTMLAVATLSLGIGANAAVFGVLKSVLLDALPYADAGRVVRVYGTSDERGGDRLHLSAGAIADYAEHQQSFEGMSAFYPTTYEVIYRPDGGPRVLAGALIGAAFLETLGVRPALGRAFTRHDIESDAFVMMLSHDAWRREFGEDASVIGTSLSIDADMWQVVGVLPEDFVGPMGPADFWFPFDARAGLSDPVRSRMSPTLGLVARLRRDVTTTAAQRDLSAIAAQLARAHPDTDAGHDVMVVSMRESMAGDTRAPLLALMGSALLVLLITCANLAGALLSRTITRRKEFAVRVVLGAGRGRLIRQLLTESTMLAVAGAIAGLLLASFALAALRQLATPLLPDYADLSLDLTAVLVTTIVALFTGIIVGIAPILFVRRTRTHDTLRDTARGASESLRSRRLRGLLVSSQITICLSLLVGAGLLSRSLLAMMAAPLGFDPDGVLAISVKGPVPARDATRRQFFDQLEQRVRAMPGVMNVASTNQVPGPAMDLSPLAVRSVARPAADGAPLVPFAIVSDDYFRAMRIPVLRGRAFGPQDAMDAPPAIVISAAMARRYWPDGNAIGAQLRLGSETTGPWGEIVGIAGDVRSDPAQLVAEPMAYGSARQSSLRSSRTFLMRTDVDAPALAGAFRHELAELDPTVPMDAVLPLRGFLDENVNAQKLPAFVMTAFAALALLLASVGVYALFSSMASAREQEFGVRMALGSSRNAIATLVLRQGATWMIAGLAGGAIGGAAIAYALRGLLYGVSPLDPMAAGFAVATLLLFGTLALLIPVRRATRVQPRTILR